MSKIAGELNAEISKTITSADYQAWLNSPLTKALKQSFEQSITDPENQPSQYGTVTLEAYEALEAKLAAAQAQRDELLTVVKDFDSLIQYQYTGSQEAMSALQIAAWAAHEVLKAMEDK